MNSQRVVSALVLTPLTVAALLFLPTPYVAAIAACLFLAGLWEWSRLVGLGLAWRGAYLMVNLVAMTGLLWAKAWPLLQPVALVGVAWWLIAMLWLLAPEFGRENRWWSRTLKLLAGTLSVVPAWCALVLLHHGEQQGLADPKGPGWALLALVMVWSADSCAWFVGVRFGKKKLIPHISPGKTWMGLWGGIVGALAVGLAGGRLLGIDDARMLAMGELALLTAVASVVGDLFESLMKRHSGTKDSGTLIPGHGGMLDRIDSVLAALPVCLIAKGVLGL